MRDILRIARESESKARRVWAWGLMVWYAVLVTFTMVYLLVRVAT